MDPTLSRQQMYKEIFTETNNYDNTDAKILLTNDYFGIQAVKQRIKSLNEVEPDETKPEFHGLGLSLQGLGLG